MLDIITKYAFMYLTVITAPSSSIIDLIFHPFEVGIIYIVSEYQRAITKQCLFIMSTTYVLFFLLTEVVLSLDKLIVNAKEGVD